MNDFEILDKLTNEELDVIVKLIIEKGWQTETLSKDKNYKKYYPDHRKYVDSIKTELSLMGGNTIANVARRLLGKGTSISYREMLKDVCSKLIVEYEESTTDTELEKDLLATVLKQAYEKLSNIEQEALLEILKGDCKEISKSNLFYKIFTDEKEEAYHLSALVANALAKTVLGKDLSLLNDMKLINELKVLTAPVSSIMVNIDATYDIAGPAFRITLPSIIYMAAMKQLKNVGKSEEKFWGLF